MTFSTPTRFKTLIFDLDDTLIESFPTYVKLHQRIAGELGWRIPSTQDLVPYKDGWRETLVSLWPDHDIDRFMGRYMELADEHPYPAIEGVPESLNSLHQRGHDLWIVTKRSRLRLDQRMAEAGIHQSWFSGIFASEEQPALKPHPDCFRPVWEAMGGQPQGEGLALYVGDRSCDQQAAHAAGLTFVGVRTGPEAHLGFVDAVPPADMLDTAAHLGTWLDTRT